MAVIPQWVLGRGLSGLAIVPQTVAADGTLTDGTSGSLTGLLESIQIDTNPEQVEVSALDADQQSYHILKENNSLTLVELLQSARPSAASTNMLAAFASASQVGKFTLTRAGKTWTFYGRRGQYTETYDKGVGRGRLTLTMVATGGSNPGYATAS